MRGERGGGGHLSFERRQGEEGEGWGSARCHVGAGEGAERGGVRGPDRQGTARVARRGHVAGPAEQGRGKGLTDGPRPQCRVVAPDDRQARAAQCWAT
jgi:hypothetical protein